MISRRMRAGLAMRSVKSAMSFSSCSVSQAQVSYIFGLDLVQAKALHQVGHDQVVLLGVADDGDGLVDVQQDGTQAFQQVELVLLLL